jgi:cytosine/adenosine deaminase-related metal-dependent hydrolase
MLLKGGHILRLHPSGLTRADLRIDGDRIIGRGSRLTPRPGEAVEDCTDKLILPGLVCAQTHMLSALARGMAPPRRGSCSSGSTPTSSGIRRSSRCSRSR